MPKPLIIGQAPAKGNDGLLPFAGRSGAKLAHLAGVGDSGDDLPAHFDLVNLLPRWPGKPVAGKGDLFPMEEAKANAQALLEKLEGRAPSYILMMGHKVKECMGFRSMIYLERTQHLRHIWIPFPHPSGINRWYNIGVNRARAARILREVLEDAREGSSQS